MKLAIKGVESLSDNEIYAILEQDCGWSYEDIRTKTTEEAYEAINNIIEEIEDSGKLSELADDYSKDDADESGVVRISLSEALNGFEERDENLDFLFYPNGRDDD